MKICERCGVSDFSTSIHVHHVVGRVGPNKNNPENLINLCWRCHNMWHNHRDYEFEKFMYHYMKSKYGDKFPITNNGRPIYTKWILKVEKEQ